MILSHDDAQAPTVLEDGRLALATRRGLAYEQAGKANQDRVATNGVADLVADGLGGYEDGAKAAQLLAENLQSDPEETLRKTLVSYEKQQLQSPAGTTFLHAVRKGSLLRVSHIGDSRALLYHQDGTLLWQSQDDKPASFEHRFKLTRYVHLMPEQQLLSQLTIDEIDLSSYDQPQVLILASDGITDNLKTSLEDQDCTALIGSIIQRYQDSEAICSRLMEQANQRMALSGSPEGHRFDVKPDNSSCLVRIILP